MQRELGALQGRSSTVKPIMEKNIMTVFSPGARRPGLKTHFCQLRHGTLSPTAGRAAWGQLSALRILAPCGACCFGLHCAEERGWAQEGLSATQARFQPAAVPSPPRALSSLPVSCGVTVYMPPLNPRQLKKAEGDGNQLCSHCACRAN